jgi:hypothetical protein
MFGSHFAKSWEKATQPARENAAKSVANAKSQVAREKAAINQKIDSVHDQAVAEKKQFQHEVHDELKTAKKEALREVHQELKTEKKEVLREVHQELKAAKKDALHEVHGVLREEFPGAAGSIAAEEAARDAAIAQAKADLKVLHQSVNAAKEGVKTAAKEGIATVGHLGTDLIRTALSGKSLEDKLRDAQNLIGNAAESLAGTAERLFDTVSDSLKKLFGILGNEFDNISQYLKSVFRALENLTKDCNPNRTVGSPLSSCPLA